jgi:hypothetical protein
MWISGEHGYDTSRLVEKSQQIWSPLPVDKTQQYHIVSQQYSVEESARPKPCRLGPNTILSYLWLILCLAFTVCGCGAGAYLACAGTGPRPFIIFASASTLMMMIYYLLLTVSGGLIMSYYLLKGRGGETAIPCMNDRLYKLLNGIIMLAGIAMFVITALETKIGENGQPVVYTLPPD